MTCSSRLAVALVILATPLPAQEVPAEITRLELAAPAEAPMLRVRAGQQLEWSGEFDDSGMLVLRFPDSVPGPAVGSISRTTGLVSAVEVGFSVPGGRPTTTVSILGRRAFRYEARPTADGLELALLPRAEEEIEGLSTSRPLAAADPG